jgi:hypothetical protein
MDQIDILKEIPNTSRESNYYKLLIFKICCDQLRYEGIGIAKRTHETWYCPLHPWRAVYLPPQYTYEHAKSVMQIWRNATRNVYQSAGGNDLGETVPEWVELRSICNALGISCWREYEAYLKRGNVDPLLKKFLIKCLEMPRTDYGVEYRQMCVSGDTLVVTPNGVKPIKDCKGEKYVLGFDIHRGKVVWASILDYFCTASDDIYTVETANHCLRITGDNKVWTEKGWVPTEKLKKHRLLTLSLVTLGDVPQVDSGRNTYSEGKLPAHDHKRTATEVLSKSKPWLCSWEDREVTLNQGQNQKMDNGRSGNINESLSSESSLVTDTIREELSGYSSTGTKVGIGKKTEFLHEEHREDERCGMGIPRGVNRWGGNNHNNNFSKRFQNRDETTSCDFKFVSKACSVVEREVELCATTRSSGSRRSETLYNPKLLNQCYWVEGSKRNLGENVALFDSEERAGRNSIGIYPGKEERDAIRGEGLRTFVEGKKIKLAWEQVRKIRKEICRVKEVVYDFTTSTGNFFANGILIHNCLWYFAMHPDELTPEILYKIKNPPKLTPEQEVEYFVIKSYRECLGREPDDAGRRHYVQAILEGRIRREDLPKILMMSDEYRQKFNIDDTVQWVIACYRQVLKRDPDEEGLRTYVDHIVKGRINKEDLPRILMMSDEYKQRFGGG